MQHIKQHSKRALKPSTVHLENMLQIVLEKAKKAGATAAEVSVSHDTGFSVDVRMGEVETVSFNEDKGVSLDVYIGQQKGSASSTDTSPPALEQLVEAALSIAKVSAKDACFGLPDKALVASEFPDLDLYHPWAITPEQAIETALGCEALALAHDARIVNSDGVSLATSTYNHGFLNTQGGQGFLQATRHSLSCSLLAKEDKGMQRDYDYTTARDYRDLLSKEHIAASAATRTVSRLGARKIKTQKTPVIFSSRVSGSLLGHFINAISGASLYRKNTFLLNAMDKAVFPESFTIREEPYLLKGLGSSPFDAEGVPTRNNVFLEKGILRQYVLGSYSARRLGLASTANSGGVHNLAINATVDTLKTLMQRMGTGLFVTELMGQGVNGLTGDYSRGASGFWVENGDIQYPVEEITIAGNLKDLFMAIEGISADINPNVATRCGSIWVREMMVAGA